MSRFSINRAPSLTDVTAAVVTGAGLPMSLAPTGDVAGDGAEHDYALTMPDGFAPVTGHKYRVAGSFFARGGSGDDREGVPVVTVNLRNAIVIWTGTTWSMYARGELNVLWDEAVGVRTEYFASHDELPGLGTAAGALTLAHTLLSGHTAVFEADLTIADVGLGGDY